MYNLPVFSQLIELLHWVLVTLSDFFKPLGYSWQWGLAIIGLTIIVRLILFPLTWKQYKSAQQMQLIQPQIKELQKKYKNDRGKLQEETMKLYSEHRVNPFASCLPLLLQLPVFIALYATIAGKGPLYQNPAMESVQALYKAGFLWIHQWVAHPGMIPPPTFPAPGGIGGLGQPDHTYILLVLYVVTQMISTELMLVTQTDKTQKMIMRAMPIMFVLFLYRFPAGLFVYWVTTNIWTIGQQLIIRRTMPKPAEMAARAKAQPPKKRSRFMEAIMASQSEAMKQREQQIEKKKAAGTSAAKKPAPGGKKPPPGKGKRKPGQAQSGKPPAKPGGQSPKAKPAAAADGGSSMPSDDGDSTTGTGGQAED
jgi:YidC/Oxa1 family membrane protein insertase